MKHKFRATAWVYISVITCIGIAVQAKTSDSQCYWTNTEMKIDGKANDWQTDKGAFLANQNAVIQTCNDKAFLYVLFRTNDIRWVHVIKTKGITFYFDPKGGKKKDFALHYRGGPDMKQLMAGRNNQANTANQMRPEGLAWADSGMRIPSLTCNIKDWLIDKEISFDGTDGPTAAFDTSLGFYTYEFRVPLTEASVRYYGIGAEAGNKVSIGALWGGMNEKKKGNPHLGKEVDDFGPMGGGGMAGGRLGAGMAGNGNMKQIGDHDPMTKKQEVWVKAVIAPFTSPVSAKSVNKNGN